MSRNDNRNAGSANSATASPGTGATKLCHIVKRPDFEGYGFNLHSEKIKPGQYIGKVDANSPAEVAGLKEGDRIIEVNGVPIGSETHKQVVQRIKAVACEVRLLLVDVDGESSSPTSPQPTAPAATVNGNSNVTAHVEPPSSTVNEMPGASANISSISVVSTKRMSSTSSNSKGSDVDETDRAITTPVRTGHTHHHNGNSLKMSELVSESKTLPAAINNNNNNSVMTPPPPSATMATVPSPPPSAAVSSNSSSTLPAQPRTGGLQLPGTAAEMRAKLMSKKKYDPKNESVDLKKKFEIIQKL